MRESERTEWRGDLFRSDLAQVLPHLPDEAVIQRPYQDTITVFYAEAGRWVEDSQPVRVRAYGNLPDLSPHAVAAFIRHRLSGKVQVKESVHAEVGDEVHMESAGQGGGRVFPHLPQHLHVGDRAYTPHSIRIARRIHYGAGPLLGEAPDAPELHRVTIDQERHIYRLADRDEPAYLGDLGPRIEVKAPNDGEAARVRRALDVDAVAETLPFRSLELLFQDLLLSQLSVARESSFPEVEGKLELVDPARAALGLEEALLDWTRNLPDARLLLPFPNRIVRLRRYHICDCALDDREWTVVETMSGKLSTKIKAADRVRDEVLLRDTEASHATEREGRNIPLRQFLDEHRLREVNVFDKHQVQFPFVLGNGHAFLVKVDDCRDRRGDRLVQCELETIGSTRGDRLDEGGIVADTSRLLRSLSGALGARAKLTTQSKHAFFSRRSAQTPATASASAG